ncbi:TPA: hypothetical protein U1V21_001041 [Streptococcus suis]|nr:hypothetical protein [Streptococcus suis]HEM3903843.1 hypothetical protein [Streptococcus suis]
MIPKFRAWDKENKKMLVVNDINVDTGETGVEIIGNIYENHELVEVLND